MLFPIFACALTHWLPDSVILIAFIRGTPGSRKQCFNWCFSDWGFSYFFMFCSWFFFSKGFMLRACVSSFHTFQEIIQITMKVLFLSFTVLIFFFANNFLLNYEIQNTCWHRISITGHYILFAEECDIESGCNEVRKADVLKLTIAWLIYNPLSS